MKVTDVKTFHYRLPLKKGFSVTGKELKFKEGHILQITNEEGVQGIGEISPLPFVSSETFQDNQNQLPKLKRFLLNQTVPAYSENLNGQFAIWFKDEKWTASIQFGIEMAVLTLKANTRKIPLAQLVDKNFEPKVPINALLQGTNEDMISQLRQLIQQGYRTIKLKVGRTSILEVIKKGKAINSLLENKALLRIDANQSLSLEDAVKLGHEIGLTAVEYIEEPFSHIDQIPEFYKETTLPVALDESLKNLSLKDIKSLKGIEVIVIKPTLIGGIEKTKQLIHQAKQLGIRSVVSSSFETGLGILVLANLAACFTKNIPAGLDTLKWFEKDLLNKPLQIDNGAIDLKSLNLNKRIVNYNLLREI